MCILLFGFQIFLPAQEVKYSMDTIDIAVDTNTVDATGVNEELHFYETKRHDRYAFLEKGNKGKTQILVLVPERRNRKRAFSNSMVLIGASIAGMGILYVMPESVTNWDDEDRSWDNILGKWRDNVCEGPVLDEDNFFLNWVMHPYFGAVYYQAMRGSGYNWRISFLYSAVASTFYWEYGIESLAEVPSTQDLLITPLVGSALGEGFHWARKKIKSSEDRIMGSLFLGRTSLFLLDPLNEVHDIFLRRRIRRNKKNEYEFHSFLAPQSTGFMFGMQIRF